MDFKSIKGRTAASAVMGVMASGVLASSAFGAFTPIVGIGTQKRVTLPDIALSSPVSFPSGSFKPVSLCERRISRSTGSSSLSCLPSGLSRLTLRLTVAWSPFERQPMIARRNDVVHCGSGHTRGASYQVERYPSNKAQITMYQQLDNGITLSSPVLTGTIHLVGLCY